MKYLVTHATEYRYGGTVSVSHHLAHLTPRTLPGQTCLAHELQVDPRPDHLSRRTDYYGNEATLLIVQSAHQQLAVRATSLVDVQAPLLPPFSSTPAWERATDLSATPLAVVEQAMIGPLGRLGIELAAYARPSFPEGRPLLEAVRAFTTRLHADMVFDPNATTVATPLSQVFVSRRGVCQDFARLEIACLRSLGLAARYVSGYLETMPPPGQARLVGADASHAWLSVYCPGTGWVDVDPTNNLFPTDAHVTVAWGRDFTDVSPVRGVILGGGDHVMTVSVDVARQA